MNRPLAMLAVTTSLVSACTALSGLDADYELAPPSGAVDAGPDGLVGPSEAGASDAPVDTSSPSDGAGCSDTCLHSCAELKSAGQNTSGLYFIQGSSGEELQVYCDMELGNGGWTLIARSTPPDAGTHGVAFGWFSTTGAAADDSRPYSLGVQRLGFAPKEMLFGSNSAGKGWGPNAYRADLPQDFVNIRKNSAVSITPLTAVKGTCQSGGAMHSYAGYTVRTDVYFFRDNASDDEVFGLFDNRWYDNIGASCPYAGELNGLQGMIFVR